MSNLTIDPPQGFTAVYMKMDGHYCRQVHSKSRPMGGNVIQKSKSPFTDQTAIFYVNLDTLKTGTHIISSKIPDRWLADKNGRWTCYFRKDGDYEQRVWKLTDKGKLINSKSGDAVRWENDNGIVMRQDTSKWHKVAFERVPIPKTKVRVTEEVSYVPFALNRSDQPMTTAISKSVEKFVETVVFNKAFKELRMGFELEVGGQYTTGNATLEASLRTEVENTSNVTKEETTTKREKTKWEQSSVLLSPMTGRFLTTITYTYRLKEGNQAVMAVTEALVEEQMKIDKNGKQVLNSARGFIFA